MSDMNKVLTRRFYEEVLNNRNVAVIDELCAPTVVDHNPMPGQRAGVDGMKDAVQEYWRAFPDLKINVEELLAERDVVVARFTASGTHKGSFFGVAPTGKRATFHGIDMVRIENGKAAEIWHEGNDLAVAMHLSGRLAAEASV